MKDQNDHPAIEREFLEWIAAVYRLCSQEELGALADAEFLDARSQRGAFQS